MNPKDSESAERWVRAQKVNIYMFLTSREKKQNIKSERKKKRKKTKTREIGKSYEREVDWTCDREY